MLDIDFLCIVVFPLVPFLFFVILLYCLRFTASDYLFGIVKLFFITMQHILYIYLQVASVYVYQIFGVMLLLCAIVGKFAAIFITIPYPVLGGVQIMGFGMFIGLVLSNLQYIDMQSTRNLAVIGISILVGLIVPFWATNNPKALQTGKTFLYYIRNVTMLLIGQEIYVSDEAIGSFC